MPINSVPINTEVVNSFTSNIPGGTVFRVSQQISTKYSGSVLGITQSINYLATSSSSVVCSFTQKVEIQQASTSVFNITQLIINP